MIDPTFPQEILAMAKLEQNRRLDMDQQVINIEHLKVKKDHVAFIVGASLSSLLIAGILGLCVYGFRLGFANPTAWIAASSIASLAIAIRFGNRKSTPVK